MNNSSVDKINRLFEKGVSRRNFLATAGAVGAATMLSGCDDSAVTSTTTAVNDNDILNFALNLEYLEAEFYLRAATGSGLAAADISGSGTAGSVTGGTRVGGTLSTFQTNFINELAYTEQQHVRALRATLGMAAVARPAIDLNAGFSGAVAAANNLSPSTATLPAIPAAFSPFASFDAFLVGAFTFEDVGVTAYNGAAPLISNAGITSGVLAAAAGIMAVEAYHGAAVRTQLTANTINQGYTAYPYALYANRIISLRAALGGANETYLAGFGATPSTIASVGVSTIVPSNSNALAYSRSTDQVLHIVYGTFSNTSGSATLASGVKAGGFFPAGLNGTISVTAS